MMIPLIVSTCIHLVFIFAAVSCEKDSIYDILKAHGLPMGLLPKGISRFDIDDTGRFEIGALSGIAAQELFLWFPVKGIGVDVPSSGLIYFDVGVVVKQLPLSMFETPKDCMAVGDFESGDSIPDDDLLAESIAKSQSAKLGHELDQGSLGGTILRNCRHTKSSRLLAMPGWPMRGKLEVFKHTFSMIIMVGISYGLWNIKMEMGAFGR
ncbi:hypothetical protein GOBAR_AA05679 [Gossypium barbadense]|uniref:Uncharacterized protein n=1 Tax=Gossypium barbadense TaxID=3634 RepID=A0A2P5YH25_GOSBA|nr:hypothetical protein GOBAR_AA05679 [Gossypium barbadense]